MTVNFPSPPREPKKRSQKHFIRKGGNVCELNVLHFLFHGLTGDIEPSSVAEEAGKFNTAAGLYLIKTSHQRRKKILLLRVFIA